MTRKTSHYFFGAQTAVLLAAAGLTALVLMTIAASAGVRSSGEWQPAQEQQEDTDQPALAADQNGPPVV